MIDVRPSERVLFYIGADEFCRCYYYGHRFLLIAPPLVLSYYIILAFDTRYRPLLYTVGLIEFGAHALLPVLYTAYRGVPVTFCKPTAHRIGRFALLPLSTAPLDVIQQLNPLKIV